LAVRAAFVFVARSASDELSASGSVGFFVGPNLAVSTGHFSHIKLLLGGQLAVARADCWGCLFLAFLRVLVGLLR
jgi:hypothetical protein